MNFDRIIRNGMILDGSGREAYHADVGIVGRTIAAIGDLSASSGRVLDAAGKTVAPGFIDAHRHADTAVFRPDFGKAELKQGLTTVINGNCGLSAAPVFGPYAKVTAAYLYPITGDLSGTPTGSLAAYHAALRSRPMPIHAGMLAGMGTIRAAVAGFSDAPFSDAQYREIHALLERTLSDGALGVSLGLGYAPECFYDTAGLVRALEPIRNTNIPLSVHTRSESMNLLPSLCEAIAVAKALHVPLQISHLKAVGRERWGKLIFDALDLIRRAREDGLDVMCDAYPYTAGSTQLLHVLPPEFLEGGADAIAKRLTEPDALRALNERLLFGTDFDNYAMLIGWENIEISSVKNEADRSLIGLTIAEAAGEFPPWRFLADLLSRNRCAVTMIDRLTSEDDIAEIYRAPFAYVISDATYPSDGRMHPRVYGTCAHVLERFVQKRRSLSLSEAVHKMTRMPADRYGLKRKGRIEVGADADILVFDPARVHERATFNDPAQCCDGVETVLVNGAVAVGNCERTAVYNGEVLERRSV